MTGTKEIAIGRVRLGAKNPVAFILGPCVIEDRQKTLEMLSELYRVTAEERVPFIFKASYDKANRTSVDSFRGVGLDEGIRVFSEAKKAFPEVPLLTDVHSCEEVARVADVVDVLQIPAFLSRQTDLIVEAARTMKAVNIKKGQFMAPQDISRSIDKALSTGNHRIFVTERGVSFGYNNLVVDFRALPIIRGTGVPVVFDATHSVQFPGAKGSCSGGDREMAWHLARAAAAVGVDAIFMEVHPTPESAPCDGPNSIYLSKVGSIIRELKAIDELVRGFGRI